MRDRDFPGTAENVANRDLMGVHLAPAAPRSITKYSLHVQRIAPVFCTLCPFAEDDTKWYVNWRFFDFWHKQGCNEVF